MGFVSDFLDAIEYLIQKYQKECTTIYSGTVQSVSDKSCSMNINGNVYNNIAYYGIAPIVGNSYRVFVPFNNMSLAFIIVPSTTTSGSSDVSSVNGKTGDVVLNYADVGALPNTTVIPNKTSQLDNDSGYITNSALTDYAKKTEIPTKTSELTNDSGYITNTALEPYAKTVDIPTKTSQLNNDSGYITANDVPVKSVDGATGDVVTNAVKTITQTLTDAQKQQARTNIGAGTSSFDGDYNSLTNKPTIPTKTSDITNDSGYLTSVPVTSVNGKTGDVVLTAGDVGAVSKTGDTMTGNLTVGSASLQTNGYVTGTWLRTTANTSLGSAASKIAVLNDGLVYSRTTEQIKSDIGLGNVDNVKQYSASNPPPYPVTSVNGKTGDVVLDAGGTHIITSTSQPLEQSAGDYWYHVTGTAHI